MERFEGAITELFANQDSDALQQFNAQRSSKHKDIDTQMAVAESVLSDVTSAADENLSLYDILKRQMLTAGADKFLVVGGSLSGIQDFLFDTTSKEALKRLRGRSFFLSLLIDTVVEVLCGEFNLSRQSLLYNSGGTFCMFIPDDGSGVAERFNATAAALKQAVFAQYGKHLILLNAVPASLTEVESQLQEVLSKLQKRKVQDKNTPLCHLLKEQYEDIFVPYTPTKDSSLDQTMSRIGQQLGSTKYCFVSRSGKSITGANVSITPIKGYAITYNLLGSITDECRISDGYTIVYNDTPLPDNTPSRREYIAGVGSTTRSFEELHISYLGVLRMDVDNLGVTLRRSFAGSNPLASYARMSRQLDIYFKRELNKMWLKGRYNDSVVIVYSGGDDLFLVGEWSKVIEMAQKINDNSRDFFAATPITISAGIALTDIKYPLIRAADMGATEESRAKRFAYGESSKNSLSLFGTPMRWDVEFKRVTDIYNEFNALLSCGKSDIERGTKTIIRRILNYAEMAHFSNRMIEPVRLIWLITYDLSRCEKRYRGCEDIIRMCKKDITAGNTILGSNIDSPYHSLELWAVAARMIEINNRN